MYRTARATSTHVRAADTAQPDVVRLSLPAKKYIFSQVSIVSSVMPEDDSFLIRPETARYVNSNGDAWTNASLKANYPSFIGGFNYINHVQVPDLAVGFLADAALRRLVVDNDKNLFVYFVDLLVATHIPSHPQLAQKIVSGKVEYLSMGCESFVSTCSACGHTAEDEYDFCTHLSDQKGKTFVDKYGMKRTIAELLGTEKPGSVRFYEASWLSEIPAFGGAVKRNLLPIQKDQTVLIEMDRKNFEKEAVQMFVGRD